MAAFHFRRTSEASPRSEAALSLEQVRGVVAEVVQPGHFFASPAISLEWQHQAGAESFWEIYKGRLLDGSQTRERRALESWNVFLLDDGRRPPEPLLAVKLDTAERQLYVTRAIRCYAWEGYDAGDKVILSRETRKWVRELVAAVDVARAPDPEALRDELIGRLFQAVVGVSRLPLTSIEAPLPAFTFGALAYCHQPELPASAADRPLCSWRAIIDRALVSGLAWLEKAKLLEAVLRATPRDQLAEAASRFAARWEALGHTSADLVRLLRTLFEEVALSPWTAFVDNALALVQLLMDAGRLPFAAGVDFLSYLLRHLGRHLTAYDLVTFHHRGANYPDALLLDAALHAYLDLAERHPALFTSSDASGRVRRRALRHAWLLRRWYEGHAVPDAPTSPGENARVLPPSHPRVPEEQLLDPSKRTRRLFVDHPRTGPLSPVGDALLRQSIEDLSDPHELRELGMALFLDRPLGAFLAPGEPDQTLLLSYEAFSRSIASRRLRYLREVLQLPAPSEDSVARLQVPGVPLAPRRYRTRPEIVSLDDAFKSAGDFLLLRTTRRSVEDFLALFDFASLAQRLKLDYLLGGQCVLIVRSATVVGVLTIYDAALHRRLELQVVPESGLHVLRVWDPEEQDVQSEGIVVASRR